MRTVKAMIISILAVGLLAGSVVGVAAQSAVVSGRMAGGDDCEVTPEGAEFCTTGGRWEFDDPRLTGDVEETIAMEDSARGIGFEGGFILTGDVRVTNDEGAWSGQYLQAIFDPTRIPERFRSTDIPPQFDSGNHWVLFGEGAYEGLTAYIGDDPKCCWGIILQ